MAVERRKYATLKIFLLGGGMSVVLTLLGYFAYVNDKFNKIDNLIEWKTEHVQDTRDQNKKLDEINLKVTRVESKLDNLTKKEVIASYNDN